MNDHIGKPIDRERLCENIRRWLPSGDNDSARLESMSSDFDRSIFDAFVLGLGADKAERIAARFLKNLTCAFKSTFIESQHEARSLVNIAGMLGLGGLVRACRAIAEFAPPQASKCGGQALQDLQRAQLSARQTLARQMLPKLHEMAHVRIGDEARPMATARQATVN